jgi:outer membrane biosynthesis protein TonB
MLDQEVIPSALRRILVGSAVVHVALLGALAGGGMIRWPSSKRPQNVLTTKLVKLGVKRDEALLPRLPAEPPPPPPKEVPVAPAPAPARAPATPAPKEAVADAKDRLSEMKRVSSALDRLKRMSDTETAGDPEGVEDGEVTDAKLAIVGNKYVTEIYRCLKKHYAIEGISESRVAGKSVQVVIRVQGDGRLFGERVVQSSGIGAFDVAVQKSVMACGKVSPPPSELRQEVYEEGILIDFKP